MLVQFDQVSFYLYFCIILYLWNEYIISFSCFVFLILESILFWNPHCNHLLNDLYGKQNDPPKMSVCHISWDLLICWLHTKRDLAVIIKTTALYYLSKFNPIPWGLKSRELYFKSERFSERGEKRKMAEMEVREILSMKELIHSS